MKSETTAPITADNPWRPGAPDNPSGYIPDPNYAIQGFKYAQQELAELEDRMGRLRLMRRQQLQALAANGWTLAKIGEAVGLSRGRVHQLLESAKD